MPSLGQPAVVSEEEGVFFRSKKTPNKNTKKRSRRTIVLMKQEASSVRFCDDNPDGVQVMRELLISDDVMYCVRLTVIYFDLQ